MDNSWKIEEPDDPRTWGDELVPDNEKTIEAPAELPITQYIDTFLALIDVSGQVAYYRKMKDSLVSNASTAKIISSAYNYSVKDYERKLNLWIEKSLCLYERLRLYAIELCFALPRGNGKYDFLDSLEASRERRKAYKGYLRTCQKNDDVLSPMELEEKFQKRFRKAS